MTDGIQPAVTRNLLYTVLMLSYLACNGEISGSAPALPGGSPSSDDAFGGDGAPAAPPACGAEALSPARISRLSGVEYARTLADLFELEAPPELSLEPDPQVDGFHNNAGALTVSAALAGQLLKVAGQFAERGIEQFARYSGCDAQALGDAACVERFVTGFGKRAFRRPVSADETARYLAIYQVGVASGGAELGVRQVVKTMLQSPHFLYRTELGAVTASPAGLVRLEPFELAAALSYTAWGTMPDDELSGAAESGQLAQPGLLSAQVQRLLGHTKAQHHLRQFGRQWLGARLPQDLVRSSQLAPEFASAKRDLEEELERLLEAAFTAPDARLSRIFAADDSYLSKSLASFYGLPGPSAEGVFEAVHLGAEPFVRQGRIGLLTSGWLIASWSGEEGTAPMTRGKMIYNRLLCQDLPDPPPELQIPEPPDEENLTTRRKFALHGELPACAGCHKTLDSVAFALEHFDNVGRYRADEHGHPIDASGSIVGTDVDGPFQNMAELGRKLSISRQARLCLSREYMRFASGSGRHADSECLRQNMADAAAAGGDSFRELVAAYMSSEFFVTRGPQQL